MDTLETLYAKYLASLGFDIKGGCTAASERTQILLAFVQEVSYRQSSAVNDEITADQLLRFTYQNYQ